MRFCFQFRGNLSQSSQSWTKILQTNKNILPVPVLPICVVKLPIKRVFGTGMDAMET